MKRMMRTPIAIAKPEMTLLYGYGSYASNVVKKSVIAAMA